MTRVYAYILFGLVAAISGTAHAADVLGYDVEDVRYHYIVTSDVNIRQKPQTNSKRLGKLPDGAEPDVIGRHKGWYAIAKDGVPFGFVYGSVMLPTIPGKLAAPLKGRVFPSNRSACDYVISYESSDPIRGEFFGTSDYDVRLTCITTQEVLRVHLPMFLVEGPLGGRANPVFQISIDVPEIAGGYDRVLSTISLFRAEDNVVRFDGFSLDGYGATPENREHPAETIDQALVAALDLAVKAWSAQVWSVLVDMSD